MLIVIEFIAFIIYTTLIFFIEDYSIIGIIFVINLILMFISNVNFRKSIFFILKVLPFILFTGGINLILGGIEVGILISVRLLLVCQITYVFTEKMTPKKIQYSIEKILIPLKILNVNTKEIGIIVAISISFIPIIQKEIQNLKYSLKSKGFQINLKNVIKRPNIVLMPLIASIIRRTNEIEESMISRGYDSNI